MAKTPLELTNVKVFNEQEASTLLRLSPRTLEAWRRRQMGPPYVRLGRRVVYLERDVLHWLYQHRKEHP